MSSLTKMLDVLSQFSAECPSLTADELAQRLGLPLTTCYRYSRELCRAGLMVNRGGRYGLGHRIIQLDFQIRECDALLRAGRERLHNLVEQTGASGLMSSMYDDQVINIHHEYGVTAPNISFGRGRVVPLFRGATSRVILASMRRTHLKRLYARHDGTTEARALGADWNAFARAIAETRKLGYAVSRGELDTSLVGISVPVPDPRGESATCLTLVFQEERYEMFSEPKLVALMSREAEAMAAAIAAGIPG